MDSVINLVTYLALVAATTERLTAAVKGVFDFGSKIKNEKKRAYVIQAVSLLYSILIAWLLPPDGILILGKLSAWISIPVVALLASRGSNAWHDLLSTLTAIKDQRKAIAAESARIK